ncbi:MAG: lysine--tRNA ligase, partial [Bdellovibrionales bacterium]|nr:lysine--tRNA ligase [Bdellovibrionales bacterium]
MKELSEQQRVRREKLAALREQSYPFPNDVAVSGSASDVAQLVDEENGCDEAQRKRITIAGRMMTSRVMGKAAFCHIQDRSGRLQLYVKRDDIGTDAYQAFKKFDLGDIVEATGYSFITKTGEPSLHVESLRLLVKCLHPLPEKWHGLADVEVRYRQRYLDLIANPEVLSIFRTRSRIISEIRRFFDARDYIEVETPVAATVASGAAARPFATHHNALDLPLFLRIALELPLKKLIVGGLERVYE